MKAKRPYSISSFIITIQGALFQRQIKVTATTKGNAKKFILDWEKCPAHCIKKIEREKVIYSFNK